jgi:NAD(P)-dependent dehydrogenase (short-subunit alcohol dehydrogenase family)
VEGDIRGQRRGTGLSMRSFQDRVVVITGAASGIGRALACAFAKEGSRLALADVDVAGLAETARLAGAADCLTETVDVSDRGAVERFAQQVRSRFGTAHVVINNAGVAVSQTLAETRYEDFQWIMGINFWGVVHGTQAFLPLLRAADEAVIVNVSSVFGLIAFPTQGAYNASKFAVRGFTEALRHECEGTRIRAVCVHPGGIRTNILKNARFYSDAFGQSDHARSMAEFERIARTTPERAAQTIINGIRRNKLRILIGPDAYLIDWVQRLLPARYMKVIAAVLARAAGRVAASVETPTRG